VFTQKEWQYMADLLDNAPMQGTIKTGLPQFLHEVLVMRQKVQAILEGNITLVQKETPPNEEDDLASS
jgi:hypothetical protein